MKRKGAPKHQAQVRRGGGKSVHLGHVVAAKEAMLQQAREEGLTLRVAKNITGYFCVYLNKPGQPKPYTAQVRRSGKQVSLGSFATAEEAALCVARSPEGQASAEKAAAPPPMTSEVARQQAQAERLALPVAESKTGYFGVYYQPGRSRPYQAQVSRGGKEVYLGSFSTAVEAVLCVARSPEGQASSSAAALPLTLTPTGKERVPQQAQAEGPTRRLADNTTGYFGVHHKPSRSKPYQAQVWCGGKDVHLGYFATADEAALCVARSPEGQAAAEKATAAPPLTSEQARQQAQAEGLTLRVADNKTGYFGVHLSSSKSKPFQVKVRRDGKDVHLGTFATAEEAALCLARSPEGRALQQAQAERLTLRVAKNKTGYPKPFQAQVRRGGRPATASWHQDMEGTWHEVYSGGDRGHGAASGGCGDGGGGWYQDAEGVWHEEEPMEELQAAELAGEAAGQRSRWAPHRSRALVQDEQGQTLEAVAARDAIIGAVALEIIVEAAEAATQELGAEVAAEVMRMTIARYKV